MKQLNYISILLLFISSATFGQITLGRQVIGSTGGFFTGTGLTLSSTVGEAVVQKIFSPNIILTQGFQQTLSSDSVVTYEVINESCPGASNGSIFISDVLGCSGPYSVVITAVDDTFSAAPTVLWQDTLRSGNYNVLITGSTGCSYTTIIYVGLDSDEDCMLKFYTGITPNGDGVNDFWVIENIEQFPDNTVKIFNRWGNQVFFETEYDNLDRVWMGDGDDGPLPDATYFYVAVVEGKTYKGWIELTR